MTPAEARLSATPAGVRLCRLEELPSGSARGFVLQMRAGRFHGFVIRQGNSVRGFDDRCPHAGLPLARKLDDYLTPDASLVACSQHGALFRIEDGACVGGPCVGTALSPWPVTVDDGWIVTAAAD